MIAIRLPDGVMVEIAEASLRLPDGADRLQRHLQERPAADVLNRCVHLDVSLDELRLAAREVWRHGHAPGVDGITVDDFFRDGLEGKLRHIARLLHDGKYRFSRLRRISILTHGKVREIEIPTVRDRIVQRVVLTSSAPTR